MFGIGAHRGMKRATARDREIDTTIRRSVWAGQRAARLRLGRIFVLSLLLGMVGVGAAEVSLRWVETAWSHIEAPLAGSPY